MKNDIKESIMSTIKVVNKDEKERQDLNILMDSSDTLFPKSKKQTSQKIKTISEWNNRDMSIYIKQKYKDMGINIDSKLLSLTLNMPKLLDLISQSVGFVDPIVFKSYVDFIFSSFKEEVYKKIYIKDSNNLLNPKSLFDVKFMHQFIEVFNYKDSESSKNNSIKDSIKKSSEKGVKNFILDYGIVIPLNWVYYTDKDNLNLYARKIAKEMVNMSNEEREKAIEKTESNSPYPKKFKIVDFEKITKVISSKIKKDVIINNVIFTTDEVLF